MQGALLLLLALAILAGAVLLIVLGIRSLAGRGRPAEEPAEETQTEELAPAEEPAAPASSSLPTPPEVDVTDWSLRLVRKDHPLPADFVPDLMDIENDQQFDSRVGKHLVKLIEDARAAGYTVFVCSGYRSYETQHFIYWTHVSDYMDEGMTQEEAEAASSLEVSYPGGSEHQLGLAADILEYQDQDMQPYIGGSGLMQWLEEHCADYGFIVRYPEGKTDITGVEYEPWHLRYVGPCARYIMENDLCLEEFLALYDS